jgi:zinc protease
VTTKAARPTPLSPRPYQFPRFTRRTMSNGLSVVLAPVEKLPIASVIVMIDAGAVCDPQGKEGVAQLTAELLLEGTQKRDGVALADGFEKLGASVDVSTDWDGAIISLTAMNSRLGEAMALLGEVVRAPSFPDREVLRLREERLAERLQLRAEPRGLADEMFSRFLYEPRSRFALPESGTETSVEGITRDDIQRFYETRYQPGTVTCIIAGDVSEDEGFQLAETAFGGWRGSATPGVTAGFKPARTSRALHIVAKPDAKQTELRLGCVYLPRNHPDYHASVVMNAVLGGLFSSRINLNLREKHGYTYGAFSSIDWRRQAGPFVVSSAVQSEVAAPAAREALGEIERFRNDLIDDDELTLATNYLVGVFPIRFETTAAIAGALAALARYGLPEDFYDTYRDNMRAVTPRDVQRVAREHLDPGVLQLVLVGDASTIRKPLDDLGFGPLTLYDVTGATL